MALGSGSGSVTDSPVLVITSAIAIAVVFVLIMLLIILRARHMALRRQEAMRLRDQWEMQLILRFKDKPTMHEVWLSGAPVVHTKGKLPLTQNEWDRIMPLFAVDDAQELPKTPCEVSTYYVGVLLRLPHPKAPNVSQDVEDTDNSSTSPRIVTHPGSEILFGLSILPVIERPRK